MGFCLANTCFERAVCGYFTLGSAVGADSPHEARNVTRYCSDLGALASKSPAKRSVGHPAPRVHRASCLESAPGRQSRPPLALRTRAPRRRPTKAASHSVQRSAEPPRVPGPLCLPIALLSLGTLRCL